MSRTMADVSAARNRELEQECQDLAARNQALKDELHQVKLDATKTIAELNMRLMMAEEGPL